MNWYLGVLKKYATFTGRAQYTTPNNQDNFLKFLIHL